MKNFVTVRMLRAVDDNEKDALKNLPQELADKYIAQGAARKEDHSFEPYIKRPKPQPAQQQFKPAVGPTETKPAPAVQVKAPVK